MSLGSERFDFAGILGRRGTGGDIVEGKCMRWRDRKGGLGSGGVVVVWERGGEKCGADE